MELTVIEQNDELIHLALSGRLDAMGVKDIEPRFMAETTCHKKLVIVDLSGVDFITSMGIRMLVGCFRILKMENARMALLRPQPFIHNALRATALDQVFPILQDATQARDLLKRN